MHPAAIRSLNELLTSLETELVQLQHGAAHLTEQISEKEGQIAALKACLQLGSRGETAVFEVTPGAENRTAAALEQPVDGALASLLDEGAFAGWPEEPPFTEVRALAPRCLAEVAEEWRMTPAQAAHCFQALVKLHGRAAAGKPVGVLDELAIVFSLGKPKDRQVSTRYFGLDGEAPETLESIGEREGITRERVRQLRNRFLSEMKAVRPFLPLCQQIVSIPLTGDRPVLSIEEWISAVPEPIRPTIGMLRALREVAAWEWLPQVTWFSDTRLELVARSQEALGAMEETIAQYHAAVRPYASFGVLSTPEFIAQTGLEPATARTLLSADTRFRRVAEEWWVRQQRPEGAVLVRRAQRMVSLIGPLRTSDLCYGLQRSLGTPRPVRLAVGRIQMKVIRDLLVAGGAKLVDGRVSFPELAAPAASETDRALVDAFSRGMRAVTIHEIDAVMREYGLSLANSRVASHTSPLLRRVCYGVYALLGQSPAEEEIEAASRRLERMDSTSILETIREADGRVRVRYAPERISGRLPLPDVPIEPGWWKFTDPRGMARSTEVRKGRVGRMRRMARMALRRQAAWLELIFDPLNRRIEWSLGPSRDAAPGARRSDARTSSRSHQALAGA